MVVASVLSMPVASLIVFTADALKTPRSNSPLLTVNAESNPCWKTRLTPAVVKFTSSVG